MFNNLASEVSLLNKSSCLGVAIGVMKFITIIDINIVTLCCTTELLLRIFLRGQSVKQKLMLSCRYRCDEIHNNHWYEYGHTLLYWWSPTWMLNKLTTTTFVTPLLNIKVWLNHGQHSVTKMLGWQLWIQSHFGALLKSGLDIRPRPSETRGRLLKKVHA